MNERIVVAPNNFEKYRPSKDASISEQVEAGRKFLVDALGTKQKTKTAKERKDENKKLETR